MSDEDIKGHLLELWRAIPNEERMQIFEQGMDRWLNKKFADFGKWTLKGVGAAAFSWLVYFLFTHGWLGGGK